jgi:serine/threonine protein kinase
LPESTIWKFFIQICLGLRYIHSKNILHRDIKTINVFLTDNDEIRIGDLGVAKVINDHSWFAQTIVGTPYYLSPELCEEKPYNEKSDIWALGCVLYELCAGRQPFKAVNQAALALKIIKGKYDSIPLIYSKSLSEIIGACLTKDYRKRPSVNSILARTGIFPLYIKQSDVMDKAKSLGLSYEVGSISINARPTEDKPPLKMFEINDHVGSGKGSAKDPYGAGRKDNLLINDLLDGGKDAGLNNGVGKAGRLQSGYKIRDGSKDLAGKLNEKKNLGAREYKQKGGLGPNKDFVQEGGLVVDIQKEFENYYKGVDARIGKDNNGDGSDRNVVYYKGGPKDFAPIKAAPGRAKPPPVNALGLG